MSSQAAPAPLLTTDEVTRLIDEAFPEIHAGGRRIRIVSVAHNEAQVYLELDASALRPGGTVSGPTLFLLADFSIYVALLATLGPNAIQAVTSNLNITFLRRPEPADIEATARLIRVGRRLAYAEVALRSVGAPEVVAHATGTYAVPKGAVA
jgi:uncharacterized protein (TIGR00369 family)